MKKVLIITYYWPPSGGAGVQRWLKFVKYLREFGWEPIVYTAENPEVPYFDNSLINDIPFGVEVLKIPVLEPSRLYSSLTGKKNSKKIHHGFLRDNKQRKSFIEEIAIWIRGNFFIPDARMLWINPSFKYLKKYLIDNKVDVVVSSGPPHSVHLIALKIQKEVNLPWIADFRDPWTGIYYYNKLKISWLTNKIHKKLEHKCLNNADQIITVGETMKRDLSLITNNPIEVITNGFDHKDYEDVEKKYPKNFNLMYTGMFLPDQNPPELWRVLSEIVTSNESFKKAFKMTFVGKIDNSILNDIEANGLNEFVELRDSVPHNSLPIIQQESSVLLLCINRIDNASYILTGKFFEYLASGKNILAICPTQSDVAKIINETNSGISIDFNNPVQLKSTIELLYTKYLQKDYPIINESIMKYSRMELTKKLVNILNKFS